MHGLLPCLTSSRLEDPKYKCVSGNCEWCGFNKLWKHGVHARIFKREYENTKHEWVDKLNPNSILGRDIWLETIEWLDFVYKTKPTCNTCKRSCASSTSSSPSGGCGFRYEQTNRNTSARNLELETMRGMLVDYLDHFERKMTGHIEHRYLVSSEHRSTLQYARNSRPLTFARDIDFAKNGKIENFDKVQSEHCITRQYTLFISVSSFLEVDKL